ncbi:hypothetical protein LTR33_015250 [Friedmanniomyces endolithicus]|nr:hypothetical protein LTR33_015250 [Friedmanniomyces endolithicus]
MSTLSDGESHEAHPAASMAAETVSTNNSGDGDVEIDPVSFFSLPAEIRVQIYDYFFADINTSRIATAEASNRKLKALGLRLEASTAEWHAGIGRAVLLVVAMEPSRSLKVKLERVESVLWSLLEPKVVLTACDSAHRLG